MQPIFAPLIKLWEDKGNSIPIIEGIYWLDNQIIKAFNKDGEIRYLYKVKISDDLTIKIIKHKNYIDDTYETWYETAERLSNQLQQLEFESVFLLKDNILNRNRRSIVLNSTGKDSMVTQHLCMKAGISFETFFNVTTLDVAESNKMAKEQSFGMIYPDIKKHGGFYEWQQRENIIPSRLNRCCCSYFKENPTIAYFNKDEEITFILGMRNRESNTRAGYDDIWINQKWGSRDWIGILPIRKWTDLDVWTYIFKENIVFNKKYTYGYNRVGCGIACPNYTKTTWVLDQYYYPKLFNRWRNILQDDFIKNNKWIIMNCTIQEYIMGAWTGGAYRNEPTQEVIQEYSKYSGIDEHVAKRYFNRYCANGCLTKRKSLMKLKDKNTIAMNMKFFGRDIERFLCKKCLMEDLNIDEIAWSNLIKAFKEQGCKLF